MDFFRIIKRYMFGDMEGLVGKVNQHLNTYSPSLSALPDYKDIISNNLLEKLDNTPVACHRGTIGIIYKAMWQNKTVAIKVVLDSTLEKIKAEKSSFDLIGSLKKNIGTSYNEISKTILSECDMTKELQNCKMLWKETNHLRYNISFLRPIEDLSSNHEFVYLYEEDAIPIIDILDKLSESKIHEICRRFVLFHFDTIHNCHILLGDINIGNILYNLNTDKIIIIDYGCVIKLSDIQKKLAIEMCNSQKTLKGIKNIVKKWNGSHQLIDLIYIQSRPFLGTSTVKYNFMKIKTNINPFDLKLYGINVPPSAILFIRSSSQIIQFLKIMKIKDTYVNSLKEIISNI